MKIESIQDFKASGVPIMKLLIKEIRESGVLDRTLIIPRDDIPLDGPDHPFLMEPIKTEIHTEIQKDEVLLRAHIQTKIQVTCARCLDAFIFELQTVIDAVASIRQEFINIQEEVRQAVLLALPLKPLCGNQCHGLCPQCGQNLNFHQCQCQIHVLKNPFATLKDFRLN